MSRSKFFLAVCGCLAFAVSGAASAQEAGNASFVDQDGHANAAGILQTGSGNAAGIRQYGRGNSGVVAQTGSGNAACLIQAGRNLDAAIVQTGDNLSSGVLQTRAGAQDIPTELCAATTTRQEVMTHVIQHSGLKMRWRPKGR